MINMTNSFIYASFKIIIMAGFESDESNSNLKSKVVEHVRNNATTCLRIVVNNECNLRCIWCFKEGVYGKNVSRNLSVDTFKRVILNAQSVGIRKIAFTGGEPLLYPKIYDLVKYANDIDLHTYVTTNGTAFGTIDFEKWKVLEKNEFPTVILKEAYSSIKLI
jgi:MoaA/NifB/PqqE/SkfB family radical SAM enzyme